MSRARRIADAVARNLWETVKVRERETDAWTVVRGQVRYGATVQAFDGLSSRQVVGDTEVHLLAADFERWPGSAWQVEGPDERLWRISEPARLKDAGGEVIWAPLKPLI